QIQISYLKAGDTYYWDGGSSFSSFTVTATNAWFNSSYSATFLSSGSWTYSGVIWQTDYLYTIKARGIDTASPTRNTEDPPSNRWISVVIDTTVPSSAINQPSAAILNSMPTITGTATADLRGLGQSAQLQSVQYSVQMSLVGDPNNNKYFTGT